jgi:translation initiation factor IF-2
MKRVKTPESRLIVGSHESLLESSADNALLVPRVQIPVSSINIGPINKKDVMRANAMIERGSKKFGVILAFDVPGAGPQAARLAGVNLCLGP